MRRGLLSSSWIVRLALVALVAWIPLAALFVRSAAAFEPTPAHPSAHKPPLVALTTEGGGRGPVVLVAHEGAFTGELEVENTGGEPLVVSRVAVRGDDEDLRAPARLATQFAEGGGTTATIAPGARKKVTVTWAPDRSARLRQVLAHVVVTSNDEASGEVAMGVRGALPTLVPFVCDHLLSWAVFLPLLGAFVIVLLQLAGKGGERAPRDVALITLALECAVALGIALLFRGDVTRLDGNDGFQLVEHAVWVRALNVEYFVGIDGLSAPMVLLTPLVALVGCVASADVAERRPGYYALYLVLVAALLGVFVSLDLVLFYVFWSITLVPIYFLLALWGTGPKGEGAALKLVLFALAGCALLFVAFVALYAGSDRTFLVDGTTAQHTFSMPELARVSFAGKHLVVFGAAFVKVVWVMLFGAFAVTLPMFPLHTWLPDAQARASAPVGVLLAAVFLKMGAYALLRVNLAILPEATQWASGAVAAFGAAGVVYGAVCALGQDDVKRMLAYASVSQMGFCLVGIGSLTPQGVAGCLFTMVSHGVVMTMLVLAAGAIEDRVGSVSLRGLGGIAREAPVFAAISGFALVASLGFPGLSGFWGEALALLGAFPTHRAIAVVAAAGLVLSAAYHLGAFQKAFLGAPGAWRSSPSLDRFGGRFADVTARELATMAPFLVLALVLGLWPVPLFALVAGSVRDATSFVDPAGPDQIAKLLHGASGALAALP